MAKYRIVLPDQSETIIVADDYRIIDGALAFLEDWEPEPIIIFAPTAWSILTPIGDE